MWKYSCSKCINWIHHPQFGSLAGTLSQAQWNTEQYFGAFIFHQPSFAIDKIVGLMLNPDPNDHWLNGLGSQAVCNLPPCAKVTLTNLRSAARLLPSWPGLLDVLGRVIALSENGPISQISYMDFIGLRW